MNTYEPSTAEKLIEPHIDEIFGEFKRLVSQPWQWKARPYWECAGNAVYEHPIFTLVFTKDYAELYLYNALMLTCPYSTKYDDEPYVHRLIPEFRQCYQELSDAIDEWDVKCAVEDFAIYKQKKETK